MKEGDTVIAHVDPQARHSTMRNHTGTHLLHAALRTVLGTHVKQAGSVVEPSRLRFDFTHYTAMDADELAEVERLMNEQILAESRSAHQRHGSGSGAFTPARWRCSAKNMAIKCASFRSPISARSCAEARTSPAPAISAICKIVYEGSISAGVRRIEAITGEGALQRFQDAQKELARVASMSMRPNLNWSSKSKNF